MSERLFARLHDWLGDGPVVMASVLATHGATPRKGGSRMLVAATGTDGSIGGGQAEARVLAAARGLLDGGAPSRIVEIDLSGRPESAGICGGRMNIGLRRWQGEADRARVAAWRVVLAEGQAIELAPEDLGGGVAAQIVAADVRLLILGAGHCGLALHDLARHLDFDLWVYDDRSDCFADGAFAGARRLSGDSGLLAAALDTPRPVFAVCLNRDFQADVACLRQLCRSAPAFLGMMGSRRRIAEVRAALPELADELSTLVAPVGLDIGAETPHEIAVGILAQLLARRSALAGVSAALRR